MKYKYEIIIYWSDQDQSYIAGLGSISVGKTADILLLTENPLDDIRHTRSIELVIHLGLICRPDELLKKVPSE